MRFDADDLLCERCGYRLAGLPAEGVCPECGLEVAASLPSHRVGTPWQRDRGVGSLVASVWTTLRHPVAVWDTVRVDWFGAEGFGVAVVALASLVASVGLAVWSRLEIGPASALGAVALVGQFMAASVAMLIERTGIRFFGARHGYRITKEVAGTICGVAAPGWLMGAVLIAGSAIVLRSERPGDVASMRIAYPISAFVGLLCFETLVYIGMRRMRFANRPGAGQARDVAGRGEPPGGALRTGVERE